MKRTKSEVNAKAALIWAAMDSNEKHGVRFGMFPHEKIQSAENECFDGHAICCALMDCAQKDGGMIA